MHADFKISLWERLHIPKKYEEKFVEMLKKGEITSLDDASLLYGYQLDSNRELLHDTAEDLFPGENGGAPTIELHTSENMLTDKIIWDNGRTDR